MLRRMTQQLLKNNTWNLFRRFRAFDQYIIINAVLAGVVVMILLYSGIFSPDRNNYPVTCIHEKITGQPCASCGLSHSMSLIIRGRVDEALEWNPNGMRVFLFFSLQLIMRILFSLFYSFRDHLRKWIISTDVILSSVMFVLTFLPFGIYIFNFVFRY